jgi:ribokinase
LPEDRVPAGVDEAAALAARLPRKGAMATVVTLGADGVVALVGETVLHVPAQVVPVVDTVGRGTVSAAFSPPLAEGQDLEAALRAAVAAAGLAVQRPGAADAMPSREDVLAQMA